MQWALVTPNGLRLSCGPPAPQTRKMASIGHSDRGGASGPTASSACYAAALGYNWHADDVRRQSMRVSGHELCEIRGEVWLGGRLWQPGLNGTCHVVTEGLHVDIEGVVDDN